jgi:hypothetical protein
MKQPPAGSWSCAFRKLSQRRRDADFHAGAEVALNMAWLALLAAAVILVLRRAVGTRA